eukprot:46180-Karenia_brevis.AAC.1
MITSASCRRPAHSGSGVVEARMAKSAKSPGMAGGRETRRNRARAFSRCSVIAKRCRKKSLSRTARLCSGTGSWQALSMLYRPLSPSRRRMHQRPSE